MELPNPGIEPGSPALKADSLPAELPGGHVYVSISISISISIYIYMERYAYFLGLILSILERTQHPDWFSFQPSQ